MDGGHFKKPVLTQWLTRVFLPLNHYSITNDYYQEKYPELIAESEQKSLARLFSRSDSTPSNKFDLEMMPYLKDPFRGTVERRVLGPGESSLGRYLLRN